MTSATISFFLQAKTLLDRLFIDISSNSKLVSSSKLTPFNLLITPSLNEFKINLQYILKGLYSIHQLNSNNEEKKMQETANTPCNQPNHIAIHNSIDNIRLLVSQLRALKNRLTGAPSEPCGEDVNNASEPSFIDVLNHAPDNIITECNEASQILDEIKGMLFN